VERRQLTVMFCDLVGSTALSEKLDPEELREVVQAYQEMAAAVVHRFEGTIARSLGDGLLIYFGLPIAHEDDAYRAVRTGLEIVATLPQLNTQLQTTISVLRTSPLRVRIGIHTGMVVAEEKKGEGDRELLGAVGETPILATRLQSFAEPDNIVISNATYQIVGGLFESRALDVQLPGMAVATAAYQVLRESEIRSRLEVAAVRGLTPLVGRQQPLSVLLSCWQQAKCGRGQVILLSGEAGIGKSRLLQVLKEQVRDEPHAWLECHCAPYHQNSALYPAIDLLWRSLRFTRSDEAATRLIKLERALASYGLPLAEAVPLFATLLSLPLPEDRYRPLSLPSQRQRQQILELLRTWLLRAAERGPVIGVVEDLHWADPSTLESLSLFMEQVSTKPILLVLTFRPEFHSPWASAPFLTSLILGRLAPPEVEKMVSFLTHGRNLPKGMVQQLVAKADGIPLFAEELVKSVVESREAFDEVPLQITIPATLQDSLVTRLDRSGLAKEVAQLGATIGREFSYEMVQAVFARGENILQQALAILVSSELLYQDGNPPRSTYVFKHALLQEAAYQSLTRRSRQQYHQQIAQVLRTAFPEIVERQPELLAHHYTEANSTAQAVNYWQRAGYRAMERSAHIEACHHFTKAITLLHTLAETDERVHYELTLQVSLGRSLIATRGYGAPEVEQCYQRALALCRLVGETPRQLQALLGMAAFSFMRAELHTVQHLSEEGLALAGHPGNRGRRLQVYWALGQAFFHRGEFLNAEEQMTSARLLYTTKHYRPHALQDPGVMCLAYTALTQLCLGYPDRSLQWCQEMIAHARALTHRFSLAFALNVAATVYALRGEWETAYALVTEGLALCEEQGFPVWLAYAQVIHGWMGVQQGDGAKALEELQHGITAWEKTGAKIMHPFLLALKGQACRKLRHTREGAQAIEEALLLVNHSEEQFCTAELWRLKGEFVLRADAYRFTPDMVQHAEGCFQRALTIAQQQQAKMLELRVAISLARLWQNLGKHAEARQLLVGAYGWFTEGFETEPLRRARALIEQLSPRERTADD
jgi:class 3 adenylate cyclase/tetratricopeptide (TPR) repeat protein